MILIYAPLFLHLDAAEIPVKSSPDDSFPLHSSSESSEPSSTPKPSATVSFLSPDNASKSNS